MACWCKGACPVIAPVRDLRANSGEYAAERALKLALLESPYCVEANLALAEIYTFSNRAWFAADHLARAEKTAGATPALALAVAHDARQKTLLPTAAALYKLAAESAPDDPVPLAAWADALVSSGDADVALAVLNGARERFTDCFEIRRTSASATAASGHFVDAIAILQGGDLRPLELLDRGRYKDRAGDYPGAWEDWSAAKKLLRDRGILHYDREGFNRRVGDLLLLANRKKLALMQKEIWPSSRDRCAQPIFITGFPRSGTTMIETALSSHSQIAAGDELPFIPELVHRAQSFLNTAAVYPLALLASSLPENVTAFRQMRDFYMQQTVYRLGDALKGRKFFTDKMCLNEMHAPMIARLFPKSQIFWVRRHPLDVMVSNFSYFFQNIGFGYGASLASAAWTYRAIWELVKRYQEVLPGRIFEIAYEQFIEHPDIAATEMLVSLNLSFELSCVEPHLNPRISRTASHRQVKEPLYDKSIGRWKNYRAQLEPAIEILQPVIEAQGYEL